MKKSELKKIIQPIVKECVKESVQQILLESGLLSSVIAEVVEGFKSQLVVEAQTPKKQVVEQVFQKSNIDPDIKKKIDETRRQFKQEINETAYSGIDILEPPVNKPSLKINGFDPFEGTQDITLQEAQASKGVNIEALFQSEKFATIFNNEVKKINEGK